MRHLFFFTVIVAVIFCSCGPTDMTTVVHADGSCSRVFSSRADSAFITGDTSHNPFPVELTAGWNVQWKYNNRQPLKDWPDKNFSQQKNDTTPILAIATHDYSSVQEMADSFRFSKSHAWGHFKIIPKLEKKFRWFYTYYQYQEKYPQLPIKIKVSPDTYMTPDESSFWLTGSPDLCEGMNGHEANDYTNALEKKFNLWILQNTWEEQFEILLKHLHYFPGHPEPGKMRKEKDSIFQNLISQSSDDIFELKLGHILNKQFHTNAFSMLDDSNTADSIIKIIRNPPVLEAFSNYNSTSINYRLCMPGKLLSTNGISKKDTITWTVDALRMLKGDYALEATSRKLNVFITVFSLLFALACIVFFIVKRK